MDSELTSLLPAIEIETGEQPSHAVIWLHGLGADGSDFVPVVPELGLPRQRAVRFVFPHAPEIPVTCNGGYVMPAWYDILTLESHSRRVDEEGILASREALRRLIARENERGIPAERIFLAGFSQGGAVVYATGLTHHERLAGLIALSTYNPVAERIRREKTEANRHVPLFVAHGQLDDIVSLNLGKEARDFLLAEGYEPEWCEYPMPHSVCLQEIRELGAWMERRMTAT